MSAEVVHAGLVLQGRDLDLAATAVQLAVNAAAANPDGVSVSAELGQLLDRMRAASALSRSCAAQLSQVAPEAVAPRWIPTDLITVEEAHRLMGTSQSNIRARAARGSLWGVKVGTEWRLSRSDVVEQSRAV